MVRCLYILFLLTISSISVSGQIDRHQLGLSYFGENFTHPGTAVTHRYLWKQTRQFKINKKEKLKESLQNIYLSSQLAWYNHKRNHLSFLLTSGPEYNKIRKKGGILGLGLFLGYKHNFLNEDTYEVAESGVITRVRLPNRPSFITGFYTRWGKDYSFKNPKSRWAWHISMRWLYETPHSTKSLWRNVAELGIQYKLR